MLQELDGFYLQLLYNYYLSRCQGGWPMLDTRNRCGKSNGSLFHSSLVLRNPDLLTSGLTKAPFGRFWSVSLNIPLKIERLKLDLGLSTAHAQDSPKKVLL